MSFKTTFTAVQMKAAAFNKGSGDKRKPDAIIKTIIDYCDALSLAESRGDCPSNDLPGFEFGEEMCAAILTDLMYLAEIKGWNIPEAMSARNSKIRDAFRDSQKGNIK